MKKTILAIVLFVSFVSLACWNPSVAAVPITAPWDSMNLPVTEDARVWSSTPTELKVVHKAGKSATLAMYEKALLANGWKTTGARDERTVVFTKDGKTLDAEFYLFENTGVILTLK